MKIENISRETDLREWLSENIVHCEGRIVINWIEPSRYGSSVGQPDCTITSSGMNVIGLELKYLLKTRRGIKWTVRPSQRRYHHMLMKHGGRSALLAWVPAEYRMLLVRGDKIPLRDYVDDPNSGVDDFNINIFSINVDMNAIFQLEQYLFHEDFFWK
jgi:hypothetical protein